MKKMFAGIVILTLTTSAALSCSNVFITGPGVAAVARTMDMELNTGNIFGFGARAGENVSNINMPQHGKIHAIHWQNQYAYLGQTAFKTYVLTDGLNSEGLYAAFLDLPDVSDYPGYDPKDSRPELGLTDIVNYILGTSDNVPDALKNIAKAQIVKNALEVNYKNKALFGGNAIHIIMRDKLGNSALLEWTRYHKQAKMDVYFYRAGSNEVVETIAGTKQKPIIFKNTQAAVLTNAPDYAWQLKNAAKYNDTFTGSTKRKWDGHIYMNGSGMYGIPGSWTPPARFARATQLVRLTPTPQTEDQALYLADEVLDSSMRVPLGSNPSASIWETVSDLKNSIYYFKPLLSSIPVMKQNQIKVELPVFNLHFQAYNVKQYAKANVVPKGWVSTRVTPGKIATNEEAAQSEAMAYAPTPGGVKTQILLQA